MIKNSLLVLVVLLIGVIIWQVGAQQPKLNSPPPLLPDFSKALAQPGATATPRPDEHSGHHKIPPSVTPYLSYF